MIVVRDVFQLKFGKSREAVALWKEGLAIAQRGGFTRSTRLLTDVVGQYYTLVFESQFDSMADWERAGKGIMENAEWRAWYPKFTPLAEGGHREVLTVVD
jgi:hypothetical protein